MLRMRGPLGAGSRSDGALVDLRGVVGVRPELGVGEIDQVGVVVAALPVLDVVGPGLAAGEGFGHAVVVDQPVAVVLGVQDPGQRELLQVVGASHRLGLGLGLASAGSSKAASMAMMAMTTSSSIRVKAHSREGRGPKSEEARCGWNST